MAAVDYFLKIDGIEGESQDKTHKNEVECLSWSWGESNLGSMGVGSGGGSGKVQVQDVHFSFHVCAASPKLAEHCATGKHISKAVLICRKAGGESPLEYLKVTLSDIFISSYQTGGSQGDILPVDQISINFTKIEGEYKAQTSTGTGSGTVKFGWDVKQNAKV